jgi:predicted aconitase with swiveling domain
VEILSVNWELDLDLEVRSGGRRVVGKETLNFVGAVDSKTSDVAADKLGHPADAIHGKQHRCARRRSIYLAESFVIVNAVRYDCCIAE